MPLVDLKSPPSRSMKRWFGLSLAILLGIVAMSLSRFSVTAAIVVGGLAGGIGLAYYCFPATQLPFIRSWQIITFPIAWVVGHILLGTVFWIVLLPLGLILRMVSYDPLRLRQPDSKTNWQDRPPTKPADSYFKQF